MPNNNTGETEGRLTCQKLKDILNNNAEKMEEKLSKISDDISEMRNEIIKNLVEENKKLQKKVKNLEEKVKKIAISTEATNQYGRRNNIEISGIPDYVNDEDLEETVKDILEKIDVKTKKSLPQIATNKKQQKQKSNCTFCQQKNLWKCLKSEKKIIKRQHGIP